VNSQLGDLINDLVVRTDRLITGMGPPSSGQRSKTRIYPVHLAWSAALRTCRAIIIDGSIEYVACSRISTPLYIWFPESGKAVNMSTSTSHKSILTESKPFRILV